MKRYGNLWQKIIGLDNLYIAAMKAQKGKRFRENILQFNHNLLSELLTLQRELLEKSYQPGEYTTFQIRDPKPRLISAAPYRDRVVHHALCNVIMPLLERSLINDTYANRLGYGSHRALSRFIHLTRTNQYILQCDIRKYFPSIDHEILKQQLRRKLKCTHTLWLIDLIIDCSNDQVPVIEYFPGDTLLTPIQRRRGLPIGNLTSQFFANYYLNDFDHFVQEQVKFGKYLRYVDDFCLFGNDRQKLKKARVEVENFLDTLRLKIHPIKSQLLETQYGANFVGFRVLPNQVRVRNCNLRRSRKRLRELQIEYAKGILPLAELIQRIQSWEAHLKHGDTYRLRRKVFDSWIFSKS